MVLIETTNEISMRSMSLNPLRPAGTAHPASRSVSEVPILGWIALRKEAGPMRAKSPEPQVWDSQQLRRGMDAAGAALWSWNVDTDRLSMDKLAFELWGVPISTEVCFDDLSAHIHPADRDRVRAAFAATRGILGPFEIDFRITVGDDVRWISARGQGDDAGIVAGVMFGIFLNVTGRKQAEEANELLAGEMTHRVKNLLTIASALTMMTSRSTDTAADMARELTERLASLGRAHDLVRPVAGGERRAALLGDLLSVLLAPYDGRGALSGRIRVSVPRTGVGETAATTLALVIHELATNAVKYGSLSAPAGTLDVACSSHEAEVVIVWTERGGPPVSEPKGGGGFGNRLVTRGMSAQLGGAITYEWPVAGAIVTLRMDKGRLAV